MKRLVPLIASILLSLTLGVSAQQAPDELFVRYYTLIQQADALMERNQDRTAMSNYMNARDGLQQMKKAYPTWNKGVVDFRLDYVNDKLKPLIAKFPPDKAGDAKPFPPATVIRGNKAIASQIGALNNEIIRLQARNKQLQMDIATAKTITADPAELTQAKAQIERLVKEKAGLDASLSANLQKLATMVDQAVVDEVQRELAAANQRATTRVDPAVHRSAQEKLTANEKRLAEQSGAVARLTQENVALKGRVKELGKSPRNTRAREENRALKNQVSELSRKVAAISKVEAQNETLTKRIGVLEEENTGLKAGLRAEQKKLSDIARAGDGGRAKQLASLTKENQKLDERLQALVKNDIPALESENDALKKQVRALDRSAGGALRAEKQNASLQEENTGLKSANKELEASLKAERKTVAQLANQSDEPLRRELADANQRLARQSGDLARAGERGKELSSENSALRDTLKRDQRSMAKMVDASVAQEVRRELEQTKRDHASQLKSGGADTALQSELSATRNEIKRKDAAIAALRKGNEKLEEALADPNTAGSGKQLKSLEKQLADAEKSRKKNEESAAKLAKENADLKQTRSELEKRLEEAQLAGDAKAAAKQMSRLEKELAGVQSDRDELAARRKALQDERDALSKQVRDAERNNPFEAEMKALKSAKRATEAKFSSLDRGNARLAKENVDLKQTRSELEKRLEEAQLAGDAKAAAKQVSRLEKELAGVQSDRDELAARRKALQDERDALSKQVRDAERNNPFEAEMKALKSAKRATEAKFSSLDRGNARLAKRNEEVAAQLADVKLVSRKADAKLAAKVEKLEAERDDLARELKASTKQLNDRKARREGAKVSEMADELAQVRARLDVLDARAVPFTPEESALFDKKPAGTTDLSDGATRKARRQLPAAAGVLVAEAQRAFEARRYSDAEKKYQEVVKMDDGNVSVLANLAAAQIEQGNLSEADTNLKKALAADSGDAFAQYQMGYLKYRQKKLDDALNHLSRAAELEPKNAEVHHYLGIVLSDKGQVGAAETHLRKAIQLQPGNATAHHNLAVIYVTQKPPLRELARWHYQKAREGGHAESLELERMINAK
jgi:chromosome segregation ATPase